MTLETPNGATLAVRGTSNNNDVLTGGASLKLLGNKSSVEVYAAVDGVHVGKDVTSGLTTNRSIAAQTSSVQGYKPVSRIDFVDGRNIDSLIPDPGSANPSFFTDTTISGQWKLPGGATENYSIKLDLSDTALEAMEFAVNKSGQDGEAATRLTSVNIDNRGRISGVYGSGKVRYAGQVALTHFDAFELLSPFGENVFAATEASGTEEGGFTHDECGNTVDANGNPIPIRRDPTNPATGIALFNTYGVFRGKPGTANLGEIRSGALESSTVDLSSELVKLMVLQRTYASNSQSLRAQDQTLQTLLQTLG
jgi:flagellar hook protein FlgE